MGDFVECIFGNCVYGYIICVFFNLDDKCCIDYCYVCVLCWEYGVNEFYMIDGEGEFFGFEVFKYDQVMEEVLGMGGNIMFIIMEVFVGFIVSVESFMKEENIFFSILGFFGVSFVVFLINGNSMELVIFDGDMVICREISGLYEICDNKIYVVKNNGQFWVKYVQCVIDSWGRVMYFKLIFVNYLEYDFFVEDVGLYICLYEVVCWISDFQACLGFYLW